MIPFVGLEGTTPKVVVSQSGRVACPYCRVGYTEIDVETQGEKMQIQGFKEPKKCVACNRYFKLVPRVEIMGVEMEGE